TYQSIYNILMNLGLVPIMGIPLPFFSYGGSNVITYMIFFSLITKKISSIEDKDNNNYKNNFHKDLVDNSFVDMD
ncbi:MAG: FtsW/RodA/SpoVE family cell cycle protein, partial [Bacilli bacterium]|nr:FtsW/RodA/SpoVE family cell cycle protein [Bacilli bacterium]